MEMITFAINDASLHYACSLGALEVWVMLTMFVFKFNWGKYLFFEKKGEVIEGEVLAVLDTDSEIIF